jgi:hypothetical protein
MIVAPPRDGPSPMPIDLPATVARAELLRSLGYPRGRPPSTRVGARIDELLPRAAALVRPRGAFVTISSEEARRVEMPDPTDTVAVALCTIGGELEAESSRLAEAGDELAALVLDAYGSAAAEAAADSLGRCVCEAARSGGLFAARRISPGYGRWRVERQRELLALLPTAALGVTLTVGCMMVPRKSISFATRLAAEEKTGARTRSRCEDCDLSCRYRV